MGIWCYLGCLSWTKRKALVTTRARRSLAHDYARCVTLIRRWRVVCRRATRPHRSLTVPVKCLRQLTYDAIGLYLAATDEIGKGPNVYMHQSLNVVYVMTSRRDILPAPAPCKRHRARRAACRRHMQPARLQASADRVHHRDSELSVQIALPSRKDIAQHPPAPSAHESL